MTTASRRAYASVRRFVSTVRQQPAVEARVVIASAPGEEAQADYGDGPMVRDPDSGKYRRTRLFVLTLGYSRKAVRLLVHRSSAQVWAELHERAFRRLGGTVRVVVLDNLKEGVLTPDIYDPTHAAVAADPDHRRAAGRRLAGGRVQPAGSAGRANVPTYRTANKRAVFADKGLKCASSFRHRFICRTCR